MKFLAGKKELATALTFGAVTSAQQNPLITRNPPEAVDVNLNVSSGPYDNYFFRSNLTAAQVLLTNASAAVPADNATKPTLNRFVVAMPAGNSGSVAYFLPYNNVSSSSTSNSTSSSNSSSLTVTLGQGGIKGADGDYNQSGVTGELVFSESATIGATILGSIRAVRDFTEGNGLTHEIFNWTVTQTDNQTIWLSKPWINETIVRNSEGQETGKVRYSFEWLLQANNGTSFDVIPSNNGTYTPPTIHIITPPAQTNDTTHAMSPPGSVTFTVTVNETALAPLAVDTLFEPNTIADEQPQAQDQFSFLTYANKFTAGGWRFLTYFGRDTMFTTRMLMNNKALTPFAFESVLGGVLERINITSGQVCHEETIGDYATFVNLGNGEPEKGNEPYYDYKMKDTHYVLLPQLADYLLRYNATSANFTASDQAKEYLDRPALLANGTQYRELLYKNIEYVLNSSTAFVQDPNNFTNLARIQEGYPVGNWRDSNQGLGDGVYPLDVNTALVPAALYAISDLAKAGLLTNFTATTTANVSQDNLADVAENYAQVLEAYVQRANLSESLLYGNGSLNTTSNSTQQKRGVEFSRDVGYSLLPRAQPSNVSLYGLSVTDNGTVVPVMNSDLSFALLYSRNVSRDLVQAIITALQAYPRGLLTNVGMLVTNPAYDPNVTKTTELDRTAYHGTVSWGFQTNFMASGLDRVISSCTPDSSNRTQVEKSGLNEAPEWCDDEEIVNGLKNSQNMLWQAVNGAYDKRFAEVWSWNWLNNTGKFEVQSLGEISPEGTESDAIQLWSYGLPGIRDPTTSNGLV